jgi:hypothetical protein
MKKENHLIIIGFISIVLFTAPLYAMMFGYNVSLTYVWIGNVFGAIGCIALGYNNYLRKKENQP